MGQRFVDLKNWQRNNIRRNMLTKNNKQLLNKIGLKIKAIMSFIKTRKTPFIVLTLVVFFIILRAILLQKPNTELTYTVKQENLVDTVQVSGTYIVSQTEVTSPTKGIITEIYVENNQNVKKDDPLFHVESSATATQKAVAYTNYLAAFSTLGSDNASLYSLQSLMYSAWKKYTDLATNSTYENSDGSPNTTNRVLTEFTTIQDNWLAAEANYKNQQNVIAKDQAALNAVKLAYDETQSTTVIAPVDGLVVNLLSKVGDGISNTGQPILVITDLSSPYIRADISENYATRIKVKQKASFVFDGLKEKTFNGYIDSIDTVGTSSQGVVTYRVRFSASNISSNIKPNMTALITIETLRKDSIIAVPNSAIINRNGNKYVEEAKSHKMVEVILGTKGIAKTEVTSGLKPGIVILANH